MNIDLYEITLYLDALLTPQHLSETLVDIPLITDADKYKNLVSMFNALSFEQRSNCLISTSEQNINFFPSCSLFVTRKPLKKHGSRNHLEVKLNHCIAQNMSPIL